jgi:hypothetical protein
MARFEAGLHERQAKFAFLFENEVLAGLTSDTNNVLGTLQLAALKVPDLVRVEDRAKAHDLVRLNIVKVVEMVVGRSRPFRGRVFGALSKRITDLFLMIGAVAFRQADVRLGDNVTEEGDSKGV